jgi:hypothetical protein
MSVTVIMIGDQMSRLGVRTARQPEWELGAELREQSGRLDEAGLRKIENCGAVIWR